MTIVATDDTMGGEPRVEGHRISVLQVAIPVIEGAEPEFVADQLGITLGEVHEALAYFYNHPEEMEALQQEYDEVEAELADRMRRKREASS